jgi:hypothetical protein
LINYANGSAIRSILETSEKDSAKTQLKNHVSIHLLISGAPTGDAREFLPTDCDGMEIHWNDFALNYNRFRTHGSL